MIPGFTRTIADVLTRLVGWFDYAFTPFRSHWLYCLLERTVRWFIGNPLLSGQIALYVGIAWGIVGSENGLADLFWNEFWWSQFLVGLATCWLFGTVLFVNLLLRGFALDRLPDKPTETVWTAKVYATLFPSLNPGIRRVGLWMLGWLGALGLLVYLGKLIALWVGPQLFTPEPGGGSDGLPYAGAIFAAGYVAGLLTAYVLSLVDARLQLRETLALQPWLTLPDHQTLCRGEPPALPPPAPGPATSRYHTLLLLHAMAIALGFGTLAVLAALGVGIALFHVWMSPALILSLILMLFDVFGGLLAFRVRGARTFLVLCVIFIMVVNWNWVVGHKMRFPDIDDDTYGYDNLLPLGDRNQPAGATDRYRKLRADPARPRADLIPPKNLLTTFQTNWSDAHRDRPKSKPKLVLVATSGGGIRAAVWTGAVMHELDTITTEGARLRDHVRLIAGASGGMVGAAAYAGEFRTEIPPTKDTFDPTTGLYPLGQLLAKDSLTPVVQTMLVHDFTVGTLSPFWSAYDRGRSLEDAWDHNFSGNPLFPNGSPYARPVRASKADEEQCLRPSVVYSPIMVEDGKRLLISNLDFGQLTDPECPSPDGTQSPLSLPAVEFFRLFPQADQFHVGTAARINASFPVISPAVGLPIKPMRRVVDAGYFDNYGVDLLANWLLRHKPDVVANTSGVLLVQVRAYPLARDGEDFTGVPQSPTDMVIGAVSAPLQALTTMRGSGAYQRNNVSLDVVHRAYNGVDNRPDTFFTTAVFELDGSAALSWYLTTPQKRRVAAGLYQPKAGKKFTDDDFWDTDPAGRPKLTPDAKRTLDAIRTWFGSGGT